MSQRLLVVEDSKPIATVIKQIARSLKYEVVVAKSLAEVEALLSTDSDFFAATIDYALPDALDGEAIACVLSHGIPGVVMTGKMDDETRQKQLRRPSLMYWNRDPGHSKCRSGGQDLAAVWHDQKVAVHVISHIDLLGKSHECGYYGFADVVASVNVMCGSSQCVSEHKWKRL